MKIKCGCKINLYLKITGKREDGYHNLETIFLPLDTPYDILKIKKHSNPSKNNKKEKNKNSKKNKENFQSVTAELKKQSEHKKQPEHKNPLKNISILCNTEGINPTNNTLTKAYLLYSEATGFSPKLTIKLKKNIPHGAGLGGGSSNAAHLLLYLQSINKKPVSSKQLLNIASRVGADVPFFLYNIPCYATGIGELLTPIALKFSKKKHVSPYIVLVSPLQSVSTKEAFENLDTRIFEKNKKHNTKTKEIETLTNKQSKKATHSKTTKEKKNRKRDEIKNLNNQKKFLTKTDILDSYQISCFIQNLPYVNDFELGIFSKFPFMKGIKSTLLEGGACRVLLSGTGSSIFGIFEKKEKAKKAVQALEKNFQTVNELLSNKQKAKQQARLKEVKEETRQIRVYPPLKIL